MRIVQAGVIAFLVAIIFYFVGLFDARVACILYFGTALLWLLLTPLRKYIWKDKRDRRVQAT